MSLKDLNLDSWFDEEEALKAISEVESGKFWRPKKEKTIIRVLPPIKANGEKLFYFTHKIHWINKTPYECINQTMVDKDGHEHVAESCPICALTKQLFKIGENDEEALKEAKSISAKSRDVVRILVRDEAGESKVHFYEMPLSVKNLFMGAISSGDYGAPPIHPVSGNDFSLQKTGEGKLTKYDSSYILPKESALADTKEEIIDILQNAQKMPFNSIVSFMTADDLKRVLREYSGKSDSSEDSKANTTKQYRGSNVATEKVSTDLEAAVKQSVVEDDGDSGLEDLISELTGMENDIPF